MGTTTMRTIELDESLWPLIVVRYSQKVDEDEFGELLQRLDKNIARCIAERTKTAIIYDSRAGYAASPRVRQQQADWMKKNAMITKVNCVGLAFVINSTVVRGVLTAVLWLSDLPAPYCVVGTVGEAEQWCRDRLAESKVQIPLPKQKRA